MKYIKKEIEQEALEQICFTSRPKPLIRRKSLIDILMSIFLIDGVITSSIYFFLIKYIFY